MKKYKILSIDGGGIRGILPAMILQEMEQRLRERTGNPQARIADYFDMIAGTSAGGMLACSMLYNHDGKKMDCSTAVSLFESGGPVIFKKNGFNQIRRIFDSMYPAKNIEAVLAGVFGEAQLSESDTEGLITAYDITNREAVLFDTDSAQRDANRDYRLADIARATSAAPTYFPVAEVTSMGGTDKCLVDGGIYANDPSLCAIIEAKKKVWKVNNRAPKINDMYLVSIGTGRVSKSYLYDKAKGWGLVSWALPVIDILQSSGAEVISYQVSKLFEAENCQNQYVRLTPEIGNASDQMDDGSVKNIEALKESARAFIQSHSDELDKVIDDLIDKDSDVCPV